MAGRWAAIEADGDAFNLQYRTAGDDRVRDSHAALDMITLPPSDPFWSSFSFPNGWRCRCSYVQVRKSKYPLSDSAEAIRLAEEATTQIDKDGKNRLEIFRFNPGKDKVIFPPHHPYRKVQDANRILEIERSGELDFNIDANYKGPGIIRIHKNFDASGDDYKQLYQTAINFANQSKTVDILPKFNSTQNNPDYDRVFGKLKGTPYYGKCPDLRVNGVFYEHEGFITTNPKRAFNNMMNRGLKQSSFVIVEDAGLTDRYMTKSIIDRVRKLNDVNEVWLRSKESIRLVYKKTEAQ